jgi:hypothetical protein
MTTLVATYAGSSIRTGRRGRRPSNWPWAMARPADVRTVCQALLASPGFLLGKAAQQLSELVLRQRLRIDRTTMVAIHDAA